MAGLLDWLSTPAGQGLLAAGFGAAANAGRGGTWNTIGRGGMAGLLGYTQAQAAQDRTAQEAQERELRTMQIAQMKTAAADDGLIRDAALRSFRTPEQAKAMSMGPMPDGSAVSQVAPGFDSRAFVQNVYGINPLKAVGFEQAFAKDDSPIKLAAGESLYDRKTLKPIATAPKEQSAPAAIQEYQFAVGQGYKGSFEQWDTARKRAGATNVNVNTEKSMLNEIAGGLGKGITDAKGSAQAALGTIGTVNRLMDALDSGKVMAGPGTTFRQYGLQVGNMLGVGGKDAQEKMLNTRQAIQSLAQLELDAAQQMKGQGQITEAERSIIRRAASGDVDSMTAPELRLLGGVLDRTARSKIQSYNQQVKPLASNPNAAALAPFLNVQEPAARSAPGVLRFDANGNPL